MNYNELSEFSKEFRKLSKKYRSLSDDLNEFKRIINAIPLGTGKHFNILTSNEEVKIIKARLFCRYLKCSSMLRIIYSFCQEQKEICFIEIYCKNEKSNENFDRIKKYLKNIK